jgi:Signal transduction histidine kinase
VIVFRDITEQRKQEEQLALSQKMESIGQLAAGIAHEINTPMQYIGDNIKFMEDSFQSILDYLEGLKKSVAALEKDPAYPAGDTVKELEAAYDMEYLVEEVPKAIEQTLEGVARVSKLVLAMKEFSHPGKKEKFFSDINKSINSTVIISKNEWKYVADLKIDFDQSLPPVYCDINQINQVVLNMIVNAAQAIKEAIGEDAAQKGEIWIKTLAHDDYAEISISDTGTGIPEPLLNKIFDPFFTTKEVGKGTGQGLAIAHDIIVNKHKGSIYVESEVGRGTKFTIHLPINPPGEKH